VVAWAQHLGQCPLPLSEGPSPQILAIERQNIEDEDLNRRPVLSLEPGAGSVEVGVAALIQHHELAV